VYNNTLRDIVGSDITQSLIPREVVTRSASTQDTTAYISRRTAFLTRKFRIYDLQTAPRHNKTLHAKTPLRLAAHDNDSTRSLHTPLPEDGTTYRTTSGINRIGVSILWQRYGYGDI